MNAKPNKIAEIYAFICTGDQGEGVIGMTLPIDGADTFMPFICADKQRMESLKPMAKHICKSSGKQIRLIKLSNRKDIEIYEP